LLFFLCQKQTRKRGQAPQVRERRKRGRGGARWSVPLHFSFPRGEEKKRERGEEELQRKKKEKAATLLTSPVGKEKEEGKPLGKKRKRGCNFELFSSYASPTEKGRRKRGRVLKEKKKEREKRFGSPPRWRNR